MFKHNYQKLSIIEIKRSGKKAFSHKIYFLNKYGCYCFVLNAESYQLCKNNDIYSNTVILFS